MSETASVGSDTNCRVVSEILGRVGDKWTVLVVVALRDRPHRFSELKRRVVDISQQMLTMTLKTLERDRMVARSVRATTPPQVSYELTDLGLSLSDTVCQLAEWSIAHLGAIHASRRRDDERIPAS